MTSLRGDVLHAEADFAATRLKTVCDVIINSLTMHSV